MKTVGPAYYCDFCGKHQDAVKHMLVALRNVCICDECVDLCQDLLTKLRKEKREQQ